MSSSFMNDVPAKSAQWPVNLHRIVSHLVNLRDHGIHHFPFKWAEHNGLVLDWIEDEPSPWLDYTCPDVVNGGDCNDKPVPEGET